MFVLAPLCIAVSFFACKMHLFREYALFVVISILVPILVLAHHTTRAPRNLHSKIFIIGLSKTGTTSLGDAFSILGYKRLGWKEIRSRELVHTWYNKDLGPLIEQTRYYDIFEDLP